MWDSEWIRPFPDGRNQMAVQWIKQGHGLHLPQPRPPQLSQSIRPPHPSLCISPHSLETMCVCAYSTSVGAAKVRLSTSCPLHLTPFAEALTWREIVEKSRNQRGTSSLNFKHGSRKRWADMETFTLYEERDRDTEKLGLASNGNSTAN